MGKQKPLCRAYPARLHYMTTAPYTTLQYQIICLWCLYSDCSRILTSVTKQGTKGVTGLTQINGPPCLLITCHMFQERGMYVPCCLSQQCCAASNTEAAWFSQKADSAPVPTHICLSVNKNNGMLIEIQSVTILPTKSLRQKQAQKAYSNPISHSPRIRVLFI